jgi:hypothetical protein
MAMTDSKFLIPIIKKAMPSLTAHQITGVQSTWRSGTGRSILNLKTEYKETKKLAKYLNKTYWPHYHKFDKFMYEDVDRWCYANFKSSNWRSIYGVHYAFKREEDFALFLLRWV